MLKIGLSKAIITPPLGSNLVGYFDPRPAEGVLDDLCVRVMIIEKNGVRTGFAVYDLCFVTTEVVADLQAALRSAGIDFSENISFSATHTHTGPVSCDFLGVPGTPGYTRLLADATVNAVRMALANLAPSEIFFASEYKNDLSFLRRYWMKNGKVVTNPGKKNPDVVKPESEFDRTVSVIAVKQAGRIAALMVNLTNHTDTVGGNFVTADWPGRMEQEIQYQLTEDIPVFTLVDAQGDINHFDFANPTDQCGYDEAVRIGRAYGKQVLELLNKIEKIDFDAIKVERRPIDIAYQVLSDEYVAEAQAIIDRIPADLKSDKPMTSEDLVSGEGPAARFFACNVLEFKKQCSGRSRTMDLMTIRLGDELAFAMSPGECFNGISRAVRKASGAKRTCFVTLANGECGYIPMPECFERGGYETLPWVGGSPHPKTAEQIIGNLTEMLN